MKFLYCCYGKAGLDCLYQLLNQKECGAKNMLAITYNNPENRILIEHLEALGIPYTTDSIKEERVVKWIREFLPDYLFSIYFRDIIKKEILRAVKKTAVNLHPSLLPDYKGCFSAPWAIINGEKKTGITYHVIHESVDTGEILVQKELEIKDNETAFSLYHRLIALGTEVFPEMFDLVVRKGYKGIPQQPGGRLYKRGVPNSGFFTFEDGREKIHRFIRAMYFPPYAGAKLLYGDEVLEFKTVEEFDTFCAKKGISVI